MLVFSVIVETSYAVSIVSQYYHVIIIISYYYVVIAVIIFTYKNFIKLGESQIFFVVLTTHRYT